MRVQQCEHSFFEIQNFVLFNDRQKILIIPIFDVHQGSVFNEFSGSSIQGRHREW